MRTIRTFSVLGLTAALGTAMPAIAQQGEELRALSTRPMPGTTGAVKSGPRAHFIYESQPQALPLHDDFSVDRTRKRWARPGDPDVSLSATLYKLEVNGSSTPDMAFSTDTTFHYTIDAADPGNPVTTRQGLPTIAVTVRDLGTYPPTSAVIDAWPPYNVFDTLQSPPPDTIRIPNPGLRQDSLLLYTVAADTRTYLMNGVPSPFILWEDDDVFINGTYPVDPPTVGVATFDGLSRTGIPYDFANFPAYGIADHLTSVPINLTYSSADSVYLSFFYQARGLSGDAFPQPQDSLVLEFYAPQEERWYRVWRTPYPTTGNVQPFKQVMLPIREFRYLRNGFRMRFLNYATLSGSFDHWHLDYVRLAAQRTHSDTVIVDTGYMYPESSILQTYTSVPFRKFAQTPATYMAPSVTIPQRNLDVNDRFITWRMQAGLAGAPPVFDPPSYGNNTSNNASSIFPSVHPINSAPNNFVYDHTLSQDTAFWEVRFLTNATPDNNRYNDTITFVQELSNYYAYDDGSAEMGYGLNASGAKLAYRFDLVGSDTLRAVRIYFNPIANEPPQPQPGTGSFLLTVWKSLNPEVIIHQNFTFSSPRYRDHGPNKFVEYHLDSAIRVEGTIHVGWTQTNATNMNLGFDRNRNNRDKIFYKVGSSWQNTSFEGSLMIRPVFTAAVDPFTGIGDGPTTPGALLVFPNPASDAFRLRVDSPPGGGAMVRCLDATGRTVMREPFAEDRPMAVGGLANGVYIVRLEDRAGNAIAQGRLMIQR